MEKREDDRDEAQRMWFSRERRFRIIELLLIAATVIAAVIAVWVAVSTEQQINVTIEQLDRPTSAEEREQSP